MPELIEELNADDNNQTLIQKFYSGSNILITGGTGFLGKILIEKLLRSCGGVSTLYILVRNKKGRNMHTRIEEIFDDPLFDKLKIECPKFRHKIVGVAGDCGLDDLGITMQDRQILIREVSMVFHIAATVRFDEKLKMAMAINVKGPREIVRLCKEMPNLRAAVHVSTAYSNCNVGLIEERFYQAPIDSRKLILITDTISEKLLEKVTPMLIDPWPNTYTYTKAVAEDIIRQEGQGLPIGVFRPSVVISTYKEPIKGWINNMYGPTGVCAGAGSGVLRTLNCDENVNANIVPVDMCVNGMIAAAWEIGEEFKQKTKNYENYEIPVYNYESSNDNHISWGKFMELSAKYGMNVPTVKAIWYYSLTLQPTLVGYALTLFFLHILPAAICDLALFCVGKQPRLLKIYKKIHRFTGVISYFCTRNWCFESNRIKNLINKMSKEDRTIFFCDIRDIDWEEFFVEYIKGIRVYLIGDPLNTLPIARSRWTRLYWLHQAFKVIVVYFILRIFWTILSPLIV